MIVVSDLDDILDQEQCAAEVADGFTVRRAAEILNRDPHIETGQRRLFEQLAGLGWIIRHPRTARWLPTTTGRRRALIFDRDVVIRTGATGREVVPEIFVTLAGLAELRRHLASTDPPGTVPLFD